MSDFLRTSSPDRPIVNADQFESVNSRRQRLERKLTESSQPSLKPYLPVRSIQRLRSQTSGVALNSDVGAVKSCADRVSKRFTAPTLMPSNTVKPREVTDTGRNSMVGRIKSAFEPEMPMKVYKKENSNDIVLDDILDTLTKTEYFSGQPALMTGVTNSSFSEEPQSISAGKPSRFTHPSLARLRQGENFTLLGNTSVETLPKYSSKQKYAETQEGDSSRKYSDVDSDLESKINVAPPPSLQEPSKITWILSKIKNLGRRKTTTNMARSILKIFVAFFLASILCLMHTTAKALGPLNFLTVMTTLFFHPARTIGAQLENTVTGLVAIGLGLGYTYLGLASIASFNSKLIEAKQSFGGPLIASVYLMLGSAFISYVRTRFARFYTACIYAHIIILIGLTTNFQIVTLSFTPLLDILYPLLAGCGIVLFVNLTVMPESATKQLASSSTSAFALTHELLEHCNDLFLMKLDAGMSAFDLERTRTKLRSEIMRLNRISKDAQFEISIGRFAPSDYTYVGEVMTTITQNLGNMLSISFKGNQLDIFPTRPFVPDTVVLGMNGDSKTILFDEHLYFSLITIVSEQVTQLKNAVAAALKEIEHSFVPSIPVPTVGVPADASDPQDTFGLLRKAIDDFGSIEDVCLQAIRKLAPDAKSSEELMMVFTYLVNLHETALSALELYEFQLDACRKRNSDRQLWFPQGKFSRWLLTSRCDDPPASIATDFPHTSNEKASNAKNVFDRIRVPFNYIVKSFRGKEFKFALKMSLTLLLVSLPGFIDTTSPWYKASQGHWGVLTVMAIMNRSSGVSLSIGFWRLLSALIGAFWGYLAWVTSHGNMYVVMLFTYVFAFPSLAIFMSGHKGSLGTVGLISFVAVLYSMYSSVKVFSMPINESTIRVAMNLAANMIYALAVSLVVDMLMWPYMARVELRRHLAKVFHEAGEIFNGIVHLINLGKPEESSEFFEYQDRIQAGVMKLQRRIDKAGVLLNLAISERTRISEGPYPSADYAEMIYTIQNILDELSCLGNSEVQVPKSLGHEILQSLGTSREEIRSIVRLNFYVLSNGFRYSTPIPQFLPSALAARSRFISELHCIKPTLGSSSTFGFAYYLASAYSLQELVFDQDMLTKLSQDLLGTYDGGNL
ncbi:hypothetical protein K493DRAFT_27351 [Basidiobolus meristosporus CBS 931.73]|uniref:ER transporter 6TM N-terminal domain-containing protein n=1 Tax=Basidiobolus meristosporus CBS 931.73 TaxID=1314790 RepID=A0A1Y1YBJ0_9FUNG|nr:hypothetical protein K493DRAFT_27351 [Basidiobolus meristosporus CBS 931.73]|eukprot:ORX94964.1 hypothetical protein K493DRAFT_27351 [Basidiobolus meristosporus CBS 931.73]